MKGKNPVYVIFLAACCVAAYTLVTYILMAAVACFVGWTDAYWSLSEWSGLSRFVLAAAGCYWTYMAAEIVIERLCRKGDWQ